MSKLLLAVAFSIIALSAVSYFPVLADTINFGLGGPQFHYGNPKATLNPQSTPDTDMAFIIILPDNNSPHIMGILSHDNFTALQNNIATMAVVDITPTNTPATMNYCPTALAILKGQDGYLPLIYNATDGKDLTDLVYPTYCYKETGPNPVNGHGAAPAPEFGPIAALIMTIAIVSIIAFSARRSLRLP